MREVFKRLPFDMTGGTPNLDDRITAAADALRQAGAREVYVFGSVGDGRARAGSDLDLAVTGLSDARFYAALASAADAAGMRVDLVSLDDATPFVRVLRQYGNLRRVA